MPDRNPTARHIINRFQYRKIKWGHRKKVWRKKINPFKNMTKLEDLAVHIFSEKNWRPMIRNDDTKLSSSNDDLPRPFLSFLSNPVIPDPPPRPSRLHPPLLLPFSQLFPVAGVLNEPYSQQLPLSGVAAPARLRSTKAGAVSNVHPICSMVGRYGPYG